MRPIRPSSRGIARLLTALCGATLACGSELDSTTEVSSQTPDSGTLVGDTTAADAGPSDAAVGVPDSGPVDSGLADGGPLDGGQTDGASDGAAPPDASTPLGWSAVTAYVGAQRVLPGRCSTAVNRLTSTVGFCRYEDVGTLSGSSPCSAIVNFSTDPITGAIVATLHEIATDPGTTICMSDVVTVLPPVTPELTIPLTLQSNGTARGVGSRPGTDTNYTLVVTPGQSLTLNAFGYTPSRADRLAATTMNTCVQSTHDSNCTFEIVTAH